MSSRGAFSAPTQKHKSQNVNSVFSGKNTAASKASGPSKHGGLQALGKTTTIVRRMPKPATLPSLKAEHGQDPQICLVPQGGQGWSKSSTEQPAVESKNLSDANTLSAIVNGPDLRPNWAKQTSNASAGATPTASASGSSTGSALPLTSNSNADLTQQQLSANANQGGEYPTLAASMNASQKKGYGEEAESVIPLPNVAQPQPAGYIGASGPRVSDRKLPARYYGGPEAGQRHGGQKYDFLQKMAKISLDSKDSQQQQQSANSEAKDQTAKSSSKAIVEDAAQQANDLQKQHYAQSNRQGLQYAHQQQPPMSLESQSQHYSAGESRHQRLSSESTTDSTTTLFRKRSAFEFNQENFAEEPPSTALQQYSLQHPPQTRLQHLDQKQHADGQQLGAQQNGRGDTGYTSQSSDIQQHQNAPSARHAHALSDRSSVGREGFDGPGGGGGSGILTGLPSDYNYSNPPPAHHYNHHLQHQTTKDFDESMVSASFDDKSDSAQQLYRNDKVMQQQQHSSYNQPPLHSGANWGEELGGGKVMQRSMRQPLLSTQPQQQMRYRVDSRHTNSESDGSGWNAPIGNFHMPAQSRRGAGNGSYAHSSSTNSQISGGWYGNNNNNAGSNNYPPSLLSLETSVMDVYDNSTSGGNNSASRYGHQQHYYNAVPRNGPVTGGYSAVAPSIDERFSRAPEIGIQKMKAGSHKRAIGAELSSASENDSNSGYLTNEKYDFLDNERDFENDREKSLWERTGGYGVSQQRAESNRGSGDTQQPFKKPVEQPQFRMLKRNDEKSAEYFAYYSTANILGSSETDAGGNAPSSAETPPGNAHNSTFQTSDASLTGLSYQQLNPKKPLLSHQKTKNVDENDVTGASFESVQSGRICDFGNTESQSSYNTALYSRGNESVQNINGISAAHSAQQQNSSQQQHKFNRAPGGGKTHQNQRGSSQKQQVDANVSTAAQTKPNTGSSGNAVTANNDTTSLPAENVWEKRKEERELAERKNINQTKQKRQFDYHFPTMSDSAKIDPASLTESSEVLLTRSAPRNQDVRFDQKNFGLTGRSYPQWNPPAPDAESHWDELATTALVKLAPLTGSGADRRGGSRRNNDRQQRAAESTGELLPLSQSSGSYGGWREFVNSKNRVSTGALRSLRGGKLRGSTQLSGRGDRSNAKQGGRGETSAPTLGNMAAGNNPSKTSTNDVEQDNFFNMGEFRAEDYKIESTEKSGRASQKKSSSRTKTDKDGKTRRTVNNKRIATDSQGTRRARPSRSDNSTNQNTTGSADLNGFYTTENVEGEVKFKDVQTSEANATQTSEVVFAPAAKNSRQHEQSQQGRQNQRSTGSQRLTNTRRVGNARVVHSTQSRISGSRFGQRSQTNRSGGGSSRQKEKVNGAEVDQHGVPTARSLSDRGTQLKSPVISDGGQEEWETASESSDFGRVEEEVQTKSRYLQERDNSKKINGSSLNGNRSGVNRRPNNSTGNFFDDSGQQQKALQRPSQQPQKSAGQKNAKPASHTFQSNVESANNNNYKSNKSNNNNNLLNAKNNNKQLNTNADSNALNTQEKNARDSRKGVSSFTVRDGLAGVDINDASVVVIDNHPDSFGGAGSSESVGDFEEVLSKKARRQRLQQLEEERRRQEREMERQEKLLAKRNKQQQRRAEKTAAKKVNENKKDAVLSERITVFTNQNYVSQNVGIDVFSQIKRTVENENNNTNNGIGVHSGEKDINGNLFQAQLIQPPKMSSLVSGTISTGLDEIAMTTVWNSALSAVSSAAESSPAATSLSNGVGASFSPLTTTTVIPSPIARPVPKTTQTQPAATITSTTINSWSIDVANEALESIKDKFNFTFDPSIKSSLKGSSVDGGLDSADNPLQPKTRFDNLRRSCSPGKRSSGLSSSISINTSSPVNALPGLGDINSKLLAENSDHAQLQKKLDRVKDFWPGTSILQATQLSNGLTTIVSNTPSADSSSQRSNIAKVKPQPHHSGLSSNNTDCIRHEIISYSKAPCNAVSSDFTSLANKTVGAMESHSNISRSTGMSFAEFNATSGYAPISSVTPQSPIGSSAGFGNPLVSLNGLPSSGNLQNSSQTGNFSHYPIMYRNGEFFTQPIMPAQSANSPPTSHILGQASNGIIGGQRSSRPNSFMEHALIMTQQPSTMPSTTPWSTGSGFEFLNGISATPPPISAPTPGSVMGRSSIPPTAQANAASLTSTLGQHYMPPFSTIHPSNKVPTTQQVSSMNLGAFNLSNADGVPVNTGAMLNAPPHNFQPPQAASLPPHSNHSNNSHYQVAPQHTVAQPPLAPPPGGMFAPPMAAAAAQHNGKTMINAVPPMSMPPPPLAGTHLPPPNFPRPLTMPHGGVQFMNPPPPSHAQGMDWSKQQLLGSAHKQFPPPFQPFLPSKDARGEHCMEQYRNANLFGRQMPPDFSAPPPPLTNAQKARGVDYQMHHVSHDEKSKHNNKSIVAAFSVDDSVIGVKSSSTGVENNDSKTKKKASTEIGKTKMGEERSVGQNSTRA